MAKGKKGKGAVAEPRTAEEFLDRGVTEEDHGDRWISSGDVPKGVRFYQRAYRLYERAVALDGPTTWIARDARYNMARMQYVVYSKVVQTGLLATIAEQLEPEPDPAKSVVAQSIRTVVDTHEQVLAAEFRTDAAFNLAQALTDYGEDAGDATALARACGVWERLLAEQQRRMAEKNGSRVATDYAQAEEDVDDDEATPEAVLETAVAYLGALEAYIEVLRDNTPADEFDGPSPGAALTQGEQLCAAIGSLVSPDGRQDTGTDTNNTPEIDAEGRADALIAVARWRAATATQSLEDVDSIWTSLPETAERLLEQANCYVALGERSPSPTDAWTAYSRASQALARAQALANTPLLRKRAWVARGDVELLRARLDAPAAVRNRAVLVKNAGVFYQNAATADSLAADFDNAVLAAESRVKRAVVDAGPAVTDAVTSLPLAGRVIADMRDQGLID